LQQLTEALGPLARETEKLESDYNCLKDRINCEFEQQTEIRRNHRQDIEELVRLNSKIKEYVFEDCQFFVNSFVEGLLITLHRQVS